MKLNGKNSQGKQKYKCKKCNHCYVKRKNKGVGIRGKKIINDWIKEGYSARQISIQKSKNKKSILRNIRYELDTNKLLQIDLFFDDVKYVMIDGTWISSEICLIIYYEYIQKKVIRFGFYDGEKYKYIKKDLEVLKNEFKYEIEYFVVDGGKQIKKAIKEIYTDSNIQRCLTHIQRQMTTFISKNPKHDSGKELQKIVTFEKFGDKEMFIKEFNSWEEKWSGYLKEKSYSLNNSWWYKHKKIRAARSHIKNAIPHMFFYLDDANVKRSSNDLEGYNGVLSGHIFNHRGLKKERLISFISLWIYNRNLDSKS